MSWRYPENGENGKAAVKKWQFGQGRVQKYHPLPTVALQKWPLNKQMMYCIKNQKLTLKENLLFFKSKFISVDYNWISLSSLFHWCWRNLARSVHNLSEILSACYSVVNPAQMLSPNIIDFTTSIFHLFIYLALA